MEKYKNKIELCARALIQYQNKILVCQNKEKKYYFFAGGHINFGESAEKAIKRELKEELSSIVISKMAFIGTVENIYIENKQKHHEINLVFSVKVEKLNAESRENHIDFSLMDINRFSQENILPITLKKASLKWLKDKKMFWMD